MTAGMVLIMLTLLACFLWIYITFTYMYDIHDGKPIEFELFLNDRLYNFLYKIFIRK